ncbi:MAG: leucine zipper domain-containing protein [Candidatus Dormibacteria bacterium]
MRNARPRARLTEYGRWLLVQRVEREGWTLAATAEAAGVSRETVYRWLRRWEAEREAGLCDLSSRPRRSPLGWRPRRRRESADCAGSASWARTGWRL